ncbi:MurR/RpiR family transcriptional regulator [Microlunatus sp. Y2014]|uniref:MurR/RpiR family transcriptional regulator n=1 Tax=Microlunatus sp. Y2014 TaxID=3418488 RepID=UPI003DA77DB5
MHSNNGREPASVLATIRATLPTLSPSQQALARLAVADPQGVARLTITEFASRVGSSAASVTRLCRSLGLESYAELRMGLAVAGQQVEDAGGGALAGDLTADSSLSEVIDQLADLDARSIHETARLLDVDALEAVVNAIAAGGHVYTMGAGSSHVVAIYLELKLRSLQVATTTFIDTPSALIGISLARPGDVVLIVSPTGIATEVEPMFAEAGKRGCVTATITGNSKSPAAESADHVFLTVQGESRLRTGVLSSRITELFLADCVASGVVIRRHDQSIIALAAVEEALANYL